MSDERYTIHQGDSREVLKSLPDCSVHTCVTSPPYFGLRSYFPDRVKLRKDLTPEQMKYVLSELDKMGLPHTSE